MNLEEVIQDAVKAEAFRNSQEYVNAFNTAFSNLAVAWIDVDDREQRDEIWRQLQSLKAIDQQLQNVIEDGEMAKVELEETK